MDSFPQTQRQAAEPLGADPHARVGSSAATDRHDERSLSDLIKELRDESSTLIRQEIALAKTELGEKASRAGKNVGSIAVGAGVVLVGALALLSALAYALAALLNLAFEVAMPNALWIGWGVVGLVTALIGYVLLNHGLSDLKRQSPMPEKTVQSLKEDKQWLTNKTH